MSPRRNPQRPARRPPRKKPAPAATRGAAEGAESDPRWVATRLADVASFFGVSLDTVKQWRAVGMPGKENHYPLPDIFRWWRQRLLQRGEGNEITVETDERGSVTREFAAAHPALALKYEQTLACRFRSLQKEGELVPRTDVVREQAKLNERLRRQAEQWPQRLALEFGDQAERQRVLVTSRKFVGRMLAELAGGASESPARPQRSKQRRRGKPKS